MKSGCALRGSSGAQALRGVGTACFVNEGAMAACKSVPAVGREAGAVRTWVRAVEMASGLVLGF